MLGTSHRLLGFLSGVTVAHTTGQRLPMTVVSGLVASATSHGWASPDLDQTRPWIRLRQAMPRKAARVMNHRQLTHWWAIPLIVGAVVVVRPSTVAVLLLTGWVSHLVGDFVFGDLPVVPGGRRRVGLGLDTGGFTETGRIRGRTVIPFGPVRVLITAATVWVLLGAPTG